MRDIRLANHLAKIGACFFLAQVTYAAEPKNSPAICGRYVEVRDAAVFDDQSASAVPANNENHAALPKLTDRAVMAWDFEGGPDGITGVHAMAIVSGKTGAISVVIDAPTDAAADIATAWLRDRLAGLAIAITVHRGRVTFAQIHGLTSSSSNLATIAVRPLAGEACCARPDCVLTEPLLHVEGRRVATLLAADVSDSEDKSWGVVGKPAAFVATFGYAPPTTAPISMAPNIAR